MCVCVKMVVGVQVEGCVKTEKMDGKKQSKVYNTTAN